MKKQKHEKKKESRHARERDKDYLPPAGPHAKPELTNEDATPGAGAMSDPQKQGGDADGGTG